MSFVLNNGFHVTLDNIFTLQGKTFYDAPYRVGDHINYVFVITGLDIDNAFVVKCVTLSDQEIPQFTGEYELVTENSFAPKWMADEVKACFPKPEPEEQQ